MTTNWILGLHAVSFLWCMVKNHLKVLYVFVESKNQYLLLSKHLKIMQHITNNHLQRITQSENNHLLLFVLDLKCCFFLSAALSSDVRIVADIGSWLINIESSFAVWGCWPKWSIMQFNLEIFLLKYLCFSLSAGHLPTHITRFFVCLCSLLLLFLNCVLTQNFVLIHCVHRH